MLIRISLVFHLMVFLSSGFVSFSYASNIKTLDILSLIENKKYLPAVRLLEEEIDKTKNRKTKGYYALLLHQIPARISMKRSRYEYAFMAARWAENISERKRMQLWIEAADGFFRTGHLEEADNAYKEAFSLASVKKARSEITYILFKRAWIKINNKEWGKAFHFLVQALEEKESNLTENILSNMGQIWVESQYSEGRVPLKELVAGLQFVSSNRQKTVIKGMVKGIKRIRKKGINKIVSILSANKELSTQVLDRVLSDENSMIALPCQLLAWMEKSQISKLNREKTLSVLNSCTHSLISIKRKGKRQKEQMEQIIDLYLKVERKGIERWPLVHIYESVGQRDSACDESLHQLTETVEDVGVKSKNQKLKETIMETFRLCKKVKKPPSFSEEAIKILLSSDKIIKNYRTIEGEWENVLFHFLDMEIFYPLIKKNMPGFNQKWRGKDLLPMLFLSHIEDYKKEEVKDFLNRFSPEPVGSYYLDILIAGDSLTVNELQKWLPLSGIDSYRKTLPWLKKAISGEINEEQKKIIIAKLLEYFPSGKKDSKEASLFLALLYLKGEQISDIFKHWNKISSVFNKKNLAVELFEKSLTHKKEKACESLKPLLASKNANSYSLLKFMDQCCQIMESEGSVSVGRFKIPSVLRSNALAGDFTFFMRVQKRTQWVQKNISQLQNKTSRMIMTLKTSITGYQRREWRLKILAEKVKKLLYKQIDLFEAELTRLANSSPYGDKYRELKKIVSEWR